MPSWSESALTNRSLFDPRSTGMFGLLLAVHNHEDSFARLVASVWLNDSGASHSSAIPRCRGKTVDDASVFRRLKCPVRWTGWRRFNLSGLVFAAGAIPETIGIRAVRTGSLDAFYCGPGPQPE